MGLDSLKGGKGQGMRLVVVHVIIICGTNEGLGNLSSFPSPPINVVYATSNIHEKTRHIVINHRCDIPAPSP